MRGNFTDLGGVLRVSCSHIAIRGRKRYLGDVSTFTSVVKVSEVVSKRQGPVLWYKTYEGWEWLGIMGICDDRLEGRASCETRSCGQVCDIGTVTMSGTTHGCNGIMRTGSSRRPNPRKPYFRVRSDDCFWEGRGTVPCWHNAECKRDART